MSPVFLSTIFTGLLLVAFGAHFLWHGLRTEKSAKAFPRSKAAAYLLMGTATVWFLYHVTQLGPADFGQYKKVIFGVFLFVAVSSFYFVPDFLAVRGLAALILLIAGFLLNVGYMHWVVVNAGMDRNYFDKEVVRLAMRPE
jgi:glucan phosphoethanolaminetransferase (alkaline phosphatase superfamily)